MKRLAIFALVFIIGTISGFITYSVTYGADDRGRIAALESELKSRNDKLDRCTDALINGLHPNPTPPAATTPAPSPK